MYTIAIICISVFLFVYNVKSIVKDRKMKKQNENDKKFIAKMGRRLEALEDLKKLDLDKMQNRSLFKKINLKLNFESAEVWYSFNCN